MSGGPVGVGVIGAGVISAQYLENLARFPDLSLLFVADIDLARAAERAAEFGVPGSGSVEELLAHDGIEIVVNLTIPAAHADVSLRALEAGKHVWVEKPIALDRESGTRVLDEARRRGLRVATAPDTFLGAGLQTAKRLIEAGEIGNPLTALTLFQSGGPESWHPNPDFFYLEGAGPLFDMGPYYITALVQIMGPVKRVAATSSSAKETRVIGSGPRQGESFPVLVPTHVSALLEFESGASAQSVFSFQSSVHRAGFVEIAGTTGTAVLPDPNNFDGDVTVWRDNADQGETFAAVGSTHTRGSGVLELARAIRSGVEERASGEQAFHVLDVLVSIGEAAESADWIAVQSTTGAAIALDEGWDPTARTL